ncbi:hypothetical protein A9W95_19780 [Mycobacterium sp. 1423905.2]|nr:hypothetical protein A9W95_19780 [Mycobacterium sp. 1423905.2]
MWANLQRIPTETYHDTWAATANTTRFAATPPSGTTAPGSRELTGDTMRHLLPLSLRVKATVGRASSNDIVLDDGLVSRIHAVLVSTSAGVEIRDVNSRNGTFVNGSRIGRALLRNGDIVTIGNTQFVVSGSNLVPRPNRPAGSTPIPWRHPAW